MLWELHLLTSCFFSGDMNYLAEYMNISSLMLTVGKASPRDINGVRVLKNILKYSKITCINH